MVWIETESLMSSSLTSALPANSPPSLSQTKVTAFLCALMVSTTKFMISRGGHLFLVGNKKDMPEVPHVTEK